MQLQHHSNNSHTLGSSSIKRSSMRGHSNNNSSRHRRHATQR